MEPAALKLPRRVKTYKQFPAIRERFSVVSGGAENARKCPAKKLVERCRKAGAKLFRVKPGWVCKCGNYELIPAGGNGKDHRGSCLTFALNLCSQTIPAQ